MLIGFDLMLNFFEVYDIKTLDLGSTVDLVFEVYDENGELIGEPVDDFLAGVGEETSFRAPSTGTFYIKVYDFYCINGGNGCDEPRGAEANYNILILFPLAQLAEPTCRSNTRSQVNRSSEHHFPWGHSKKQWRTARG